MQDNVSPKPSAAKPVENRPLPRARRPAWWQKFWDRTGSYVAVALGSVVGGVARYLVSVLFVGQLGGGFPWGTLFVNVTGSFMIGFYAALTGPDGRLFVSPRQRQFVMVGICGGYTTFSAFSLETLRLVQSGNIQAASLNLFVSVVGWLTAVWFGHAVATRLNRL
ncbi:MAG: fluoride efflux transporter CrcB [Bradyrhizobium sp.]